MDAKEGKKRGCGGGEWGQISNYTWSGSCLKKSSEFMAEKKGVVLYFYAIFIKACQEFH